MVTQVVIVTIKSPLIKYYDEKKKDGKRFNEGQQ